MRYQMGGLLLFLGQCGQCLIKFTSGMSCAAHHSDAFRQLVVSLVSICMKPAREPVQKFFRVFCFSVLLVLSFPQQARAGGNAAEYVPRSALH